LPIRIRPARAVPVGGGGPESLPERHGTVMLAERDTRPTGVAGAARSLRHGSTTTIADGGYGARGGEGLEARLGPVSRRGERPAPGSAPGAGRLGRPLAEAPRRPVPERRAP